MGYSILLKDCYLEDFEPTFQKMKYRGINPSEIETNPNKFWTEVKRALPADGQISFLPCECAL